MGKEEKLINILTIFSIFHKSGINFFLKKNRLLTIILRTLVSMTWFINSRHRELIN